MERGGFPASPRVPLLIFIGSNIIIASLRVSDDIVIGVKDFYESITIIVFYFSAIVDQKPAFLFSAKFLSENNNKFI